MKHIVLIKSTKPGKFNYCKFGSYQDKNTGKNVILIDPNGKETTGFEMFQAVLSLDINNEQDKKVYEFLKDHPLIVGNNKFTVTDTRAREEKMAEESLLTADAVNKASQIQDSELKDLALLMGINSDTDNKLIKAKIIQLSSSNPKKFMTFMDDVDKQHRIFLKKALDKGALTKINGIWKHNTLSIGMTDDQAILWLKDNGDVYAILKAQVRGVVPIKEEQPVEELLEEAVVETGAISKSTMAAINSEPKVIKKK